MKPAFNVKSAHLDALSIQLQSSQIDEVRETLQLNVGKYLKFKALPFILDARQLEDGESVPFSEILALFALYQLRIVGLRHGDASWERYAEQHNLAFLPIEKMATAIVPDVDGATPSEETAETAPNEADAPSENAEADDAPKIIFHQPAPVTDASTEEAKPAETSEAPTENTATSETPATPDETPELEEAEAFARELFGDMEETAPTAPAPEVATETVEASESDTLSNDNDAIKTVEMAKMADLVEISAEERRLDEEAPSELSSEDGEAKGEIVSVSEAKRTIVVSTPVRTGQQIYAEKADLIVLGIVSPGAEVIADGNIHIYAPLRGRALAGASGDTKARIFVQSMQAELVSIAGIYRTFEQKLPQHLHRKPVQIELQDDRLAISSIVAE